MTIYDLKTMQICEIADSTVVALGTFDGAHLGHMSVFSSCIRLAKSLGVKSAVYTFSTLPKNSFSNASEGAIFTLEEKIRAIREVGIDYLCIEDFENVCSLSGDEFLSSVLVGSMRAIGACCGFNFRFGRGAEYGVHELEQFFKSRGGCVNICEKITLDDITLSSSYLRRLVESGDVERLLSISRPYSIYSRVEHGKELGRKIGIPTINQLFPSGKVIPRRGVYITECEIGEDVYPSVTNVGVRPTVESGATINMETHIIGYDGALYGSYVRVNFYKLLREERKFESIDEMMAEIRENIKEAIEYFK